MLLRITISLHFWTFFNPPHTTAPTCRSHIQSDCNTSQHTMFSDTSVHITSLSVTATCIVHSILLTPPQSTPAVFSSKKNDCSCTHLMQTIFAQARPTMPCISLVYLYYLCLWVIEVVQRDSVLGYTRVTMTRHFLAGYVRKAAPLLLCFRHNYPAPHMSHRGLSSVQCPVKKSVSHDLQG